jgi:nicotinate-nucleotide adenylyltransferase
LTRPVDVEQQMPAQYSNERIGIFGGSFDPIHNGHIALARAALKQLGLSRIFLVPAPTPPHKAQFGAHAVHRLRMTRLATAQLDRCTVSNLEYLRQGKSYTIDTITQFQERFPKAVLHLLIGADNLSEILSWHRYKELIRKVIICPGQRPGYPTPLSERLPHACVQVFDSPAIDISSTRVREMLALGQSCEADVPIKVLRYIEAHALYQHANGALS